MSILMVLRFQLWVWRPSWLREFGTGQVWWQCRHPESPGIGVGGDTVRCETMVLLVIFSENFFKKKKIGSVCGVPVDVCSAEVFRFPFFDTLKGFIFNFVCVMDKLYVFYDWFDFRAFLWANRGTCRFLRFFLLVS